MIKEKSFLIGKGCDAKQLRSHCVRHDDVPASNPEPMFINTLALQERWKFIAEVLNRFRRGQSPKVIAEELFVKRKAVQRVIRDHFHLPAI